MSVHSAASIDGLKFAMLSVTCRASASMAELPRPGFRTSPMSKWPSAGKPSLALKMRMPGLTQSSGTAPTASPDCMLRDIGVLRDDVRWAAGLPLTVNAAVALEERSHQRRHRNFEEQT